MSERLTTIHILQALENLTKTEIDLIMFYQR